MCVCTYFIDVVSLILFKQQHKKISQVWMLPKHKITKILCRKWVNVPSLNAVCIFDSRSLLNALLLDRTFLFCRHCMYSKDYQWLKMRFTGCCGMSPILPLEGIMSSCHKKTFMTGKVTINMTFVSMPVYLVGGICFKADINGWGKGELSGHGGCLWSL